jgi:hypothetical protein
MNLEKVLVKITFQREFLSTICRTIMRSEIFMDTDDMFVELMLVVKTFSAVFAGIPVIVVVVDPFHVFSELMLHQVQFPAFVAEEFSWIRLKNRLFGQQLIAQSMISSPPLTLKRCKSRNSSKRFLDFRRPAAAIAMLLFHD